MRCRAALSDADAGELVVAASPKGDVLVQNVTPHVRTSTGIRGCNPSYVVTSGGVVVVDTPQLPTRVAPATSTTSPAVGRIPVIRAGSLRQPATLPV